MYKRQQPWSNLLHWHLPGCDEENEKYQTTNLWAEISSTSIPNVKQEHYQFHKIVCVCVCVCVTNDN